MHFKPGDTVKPKSGGPVMTVEQVGPDISGALVCWCRWFEGKELKASNFSPQVLVSAQVAETNVQGDNMTLDLYAIEARAAKATEGPWRSELEWTNVLSPTHHIICEVHDGDPCGDLPPLENPDMPFIAAARSDVPALVAEVRRLQAALERIRDETFTECSGDSRSCGDNADGSDPCSYCVAKAALESTP